MLRLADILITLWLSW